MFTKILPKGEFHRIGGAGSFYVGDSADLTDRFLNEYEGRITLIFLDPPVKVGRDEEPEFKTKFASHPRERKYDRESFIELMRKTLQNCSRLLSQEGSVYIHAEPGLNGIIRQLADEILGFGNFVNEIILNYKKSGRAINHFARKHDDLLLYRKSKAFYFNIKAAGRSRDMSKRNHMKRRVDDNGRIFFSARAGGKEYRYYEDDPIYPGDVWDDIPQLTRNDPEYAGYNGQLPEALLKRVISVSSREGDCVMDLFSGSGTTAAAAAGLKRKFIAADISPASLLISRLRLLELNNTPDWFGKHSPLCIEYSDAFANSYTDNPAPENFLKLTETENECVLEIPADGGSPCSYLAVGKFQDGIFRAEDYILRPSAGAKLILEKGGALHITDADCNQHFYLYS